jgi:amino acid transporter
VLLALVSIAAIAWINIMGVLWGARVQATLTVIKIATVLLVALAPFVLALFSIPGLDAANYETRLTDPPAYSFATRFGIILLAVMWAYNGWEGIAPVAEEIKHPQRNIPIALFAGIGILTFLYVSANVAYHGVLTMEDLKTAGDHGAERMVSQLLGDAWSKLLSVGIMISTFGAISCSLLISPRVPFAMGRDGAFFRPLGWVHENYRTPVAAILTQATMSISLIVAAALLVYLKSVDEAETVFSMLTDFVIFNGSIFYTLAATGSGAAVSRLGLPDHAHSVRGLLLLVLVANLRGGAAQGQRRAWDPWRRDYGALRVAPVGSPAFAGRPVTCRS